MAAMNSARHSLAAMVLGGLVAACGGADPGDGTAAATQVTVSVTPSEAEVLPRETVAFTASVLGTTARTVTWSIEEGPSGGSVNGSGIYTAAGTVGTYHVVATSAADPTKFAKATVTVTAAPVIVVSVAPATATVSAGGQVPFAATVTGSTDKTVTWSVLEASGCGSVSVSGVYTAPGAAASCHVIATSVADPTRSAMVPVAVTATAPPTPAALLAIAPASHGFGNVTVGSAGSPFGFTVTNSGGSAASNVYVALPTGSPFSLTGNTCGAAGSRSTISAGASCTFSVNFRPTAAGAATDTATVAYDTTSATGLAVSATVSGSGVTVTTPPTPTALLAIAPASHGFGNVTVGSAGSPFGFTVTNSGGSAASNVYVALPTGSPFSLTGNTCGAAGSRSTIPAGASCTFSVNYRPTAAGAATGTATIAYDTTSATGLAVSATVSGSGVTTTSGTEYHVGPGQAYAKIGDVPWYGLSPGSTVYIHHQATPYREKFLISTAGTASQWIRVLGVPGPNGELPIVSGNGATTSTNMHHHWTDPTLFQQYGVIHIGVHAGDTAPIPAYVEIAGLQIQDADQAYSFTAENGATTSYADFAAGIYVRGSKHILIRDNVITHCGLGVYNWTATDGNVWWDSLQADTVIRGNYFYDNGVSGGYLQHQVYTESDGVVIENNRFGPQRSGAAGSQIKDRSAGTVVRYNWIETAAGWFVDLVEPENSWSDLGGMSTYKQAFVYGNVFVNSGGEQNIVHWNEDHSMNHGRAIQPGGKLFFYHNTVLTLANSQYWPNPVFNVTSGGYECDTGATFAGRIDVRNNVFALFPASGSSPNTYDFGYCGLENLDFGVNWVSPGWGLWRSGTANATGTASIVSPAGNNPGFVSVGGKDLHLAPGSSAIGIGGPLAPEVTNNFLGLDLTPTRQFAGNTSTDPRSSSGAGSDLGAFQR